MNLANRLNTIQEYYFSNKLREIAELKKNGVDVINLGIGNPDLPPAKEVIETLNFESKNPSNHGYQGYKGIDELRNAYCEWYQKYFDVSLLPNEEVLPLMGSKEGVMHISLAFLERGSQVLIPNPGYPAYAAAAKMAEAELIHYNLTEKGNWLPDIKELEKLDLSRVKIMWINYPNMPTGYIASSKELKVIADFGKRNDIIICNDNPYAFILNTDQQSILQFSESKSHILELNSLSKSHNMAGWRLGMIGANKNIIDSILKVKSNMDSGMFYPIQKAAICALKLSDSWYNKINNNYLNRRKIIWEILDFLNCSYSKNSGGMFVWAKLPVKENDSLAFSDKILREYGVFITPGDIFGSNGKGYIRPSLCNTEQTLLKVKERLK
jgi:LL-diaminopimelate aminotransferase